ncbi:MAG: STAS domain-containing protein [Oscillochloris sp.]|nr:STAS domain-containing protein [Oscillochloris sp.]
MSTKNRPIISWLQQVTTPDTSDDNLRRQGFLVVIVSLAITLLALLLGLRSIIAGDFTITTAIIFGGMLIYIACGVMARYGIIRPAAYLITWTPWLGIIIIIVTTPNPTAIFFLSIPVLLASIVLSSLQTLPVTVLGLLITLFMISRDVVVEDGNFASAIFFVVTISALAYLGAWSVERALQIAREASQALQGANQALHDANSDLENRVAQRTGDLQQALQSLLKRETELHQTLADLRSSQETIRELSAPILPISAGVLVAPLIGALDSSRMMVFMSNLLRAAEHEGARYLIIDVTGIPVIDTQVAQVLIQAAQALKLIGTQVIITGIRPEVAQTLVGLGVNLGEIITRGTLQSGITEAVNRWHVIAPTSQALT